VTKVNVAQIGVGYWGPNLLRNLVSSTRFRVTKIVEQSDKRRAFVRDSYPEVQVSNNLKSVLDDPELEAVVIATPVKTHYDLASQVLQSGKHVLVEKPMATSSEEVRDIGRTANEKGLVAMAGHTFIYNPAVRHIKKIIDSGELGDIRYIYSQRVNLGRIRSDVDALWNLAPHDISIIQYWLGDPEPLKLFRNGMDYVQKGIDDVVFLNITYPGNVMAHIHVSWLDPHKVRKVTIVGSDKMVVYDDIAENKIAIYDKGIDPLAVLGDCMDFDDPEPQAFSHRSGDVIVPKIVWQEPLQLEIEHFADCIQNGEKCLTGPEHAARVVQILNRA
jgi:predicted dehydrogenase